ncbi:DUF7694 domain-containing protein [Sphingomonas faeni]|uniref:DUF7694 domain-containing protein n=1 Tax=Sphingomonas faeni TaxID=185950 RepID=UPI003357FC61
MKPTASQLRRMKRDNLAWPVGLAPVPSADWPAIASEGSIRVDVLRSRGFLVQVFGEGEMLRLSVNRTEWDERQNRFREDITWDDLQRLKAEAGYPDRVAIEVFPPERLIVNVANMRHLWILPEGAEQMPFVWNGRKSLSETRQHLSIEDAAQ